MHVGVSYVFTHFKSEMRYVISSITTRKAFVVYLYATDSYPPFSQYYGV